MITEISKETKFCVHRIGNTTVIGGATSITSLFVFMLEYLGHSKHIGNMDVTYNENYTQLRVVVFPEDSKKLRKFYCRINNSKIEHMNLEEAIGLTNQVYTLTLEVIDYLEMRNKEFSTTLHLVKGEFVSIKGE